MAAEMWTIAQDIAREVVARWMIEHGYVTGHGDTLDDLLSELILQAIEHNVKVNGDARPARS